MGTGRNRANNWDTNSTAFYTADINLYFTLSEQKKHHNTEQQKED